MKVLKFGGTSVGTAERMKAVATLIQKESTPTLVVLSALSGVTNALVSINDALKNTDLPQALKISKEIYDKHIALCKELLSNLPSFEKAEDFLKKQFQKINEMIRSVGFDQAMERALLAQGEILSTQIFQIYLEEINYSSALLSALDFMYIDEDEEPDLDIISKLLRRSIGEYTEPINCFITQGYICKNHLNQIDNLKRGGSDYTASLVGAAIGATEIQIWTDIDGMHNNDPRVVDKTFPIAELSFEEAAELAYFGAKILHPATILPAQKFNIPVKLLNTMQPDAHGTIIKNDISKSELAIKALAAKDGITAINIKSTRMFLAYGFLRKVFEVFEKYRTPIDMITTSEVAISLTIDNTTHLDEIVLELQQYATVEIDHDQSIICIVGESIAEQKGITAKIFESLTDIPIRMISYGGSNHNISLLVNTVYKKSALQSLNDGLFSEILKK